MRNIFTKYKGSRGSLGESEIRMRSKPNKFISFLLAEAYSRNSDNLDWVEVLKKIKGVYLNEISKEDFSKFLNDKKIKLEIAAGQNVIGGQFDLDTREMIMYFSKDVFDEILIANEKKLEKIAENFWTNFVHEDTHKQQQKAAKDYKINKNYIKPTNVDWRNLSAEDIKYFDQQIEADAYGREIGARLEKIYKRKSASSILLKVNSNTVKDEYSKRIINVHKDPRISKKSNRSFFKALYDYLAGDEL